MSTNQPDVQVTPEGFVLLSRTKLFKIRFTHLATGIDSESIHQLGRQGLLNGFTEWISESEPVISIGWDWSHILNKDCSRIFRTCVIRSNIKLKEFDSNIDEPASKELTCNLAWQLEVRFFSQSPN